MGRSVEQLLSDWRSEFGKCCWHCKSRALCDAGEYEKCFAYFLRQASLDKSYARLGLTKENVRMSGVLCFE